MRREGGKTIPSEPAVKIAVSSRQKCRLEAAPWCACHDMMQLRAPCHSHDMMQLSAPCHSLVRPDLTEYMQDKKWFVRM